MNRADALLAAPFERAGRTPAVLLLHGFTGSPYEVRPLGEALAARGLAVHAPLLPGHGTRPRDLALVAPGAWSAAAARAFDALRAEHDRVVVAGLSMGALLALELGAERGSEVDRIVAMAPALDLGWLAETVLRAARRIRPESTFFVPKLIAGDANPTPLALANPTYRATPIRAAVLLIDLIDRVKTLLARVTQPLLVVHGERDRTIPVRASRATLAAVSSADKRLIVLGASRHLLPIDVDKDVLISEVVRFVLG